MDRQRVDQWLRDPQIWCTLAPGSDWTLFEPSRRFYERLRDGGDEGLREAASLLANSVQLDSVPFFTYEWALKLSPTAAGVIRQVPFCPSLVQVPISSAGRPYLLGGVLAHEMAHELLHVRSRCCASAHEYEHLVDLTSIAVGWGKLVLNGTATELAAGTGVTQSLGYLAADMKAYAYRRVNEIRRVPAERATSRLTAKAKELVLAARCLT